MPPPHEPTVYVVDDCVDVRDTLCLLMRSVNLRVEAFSNADDFLDAFHPDRPGCLVLDMHMPGMSGMELLEKLSKKRSLIPVIILTGRADVTMAVRALRIGAVDLIQKPYRDQSLLNAVQRALDRSAQEHHESDRRAEIIARLALLSPAEREVLEMLVEGLPSKEMAVKLAVPAKDVEVYHISIMKKLQVRGTPELIRMVLLAKEADG